MLTTVQDLGRWGSRSAACRWRGRWTSTRIDCANRWSGNDEAAAALEITLIGPELEASRRVDCAVTGARFEVFVDGQRVRLRHAVRGASRARGCVSAPRTPARARPSRCAAASTSSVVRQPATSLISRMGPFGGRALAPATSCRSATRAVAAPHGPDAISLPLPTGGARLRVIPARTTTCSRLGASRRLFGSRYHRDAAVESHGLPARGARPRHRRSADILSDATPSVRLQVPASGQPILLMADRQTTGGYPKIATVITADLPLAGQLAPGDWIEFRRVHAAEARRPRSSAASRGSEERAMTDAASIAQLRGRFGDDRVRP